MPIETIARLPLSNSIARSPAAQRPVRSVVRPRASVAAPEMPAAAYAPQEMVRQPAYRSRDYTRAAKLAPRVAATDLGPENMPFPARFGVELEMDGPSLRDTRMGVAHALGGNCEGRTKGVTDETGRLWQVKPDEGTLVEVASPVLGSLRGLREVQNIAVTMASRGAKTHESTGVHFHVDARNMDVPHMIRLIALLARHERHLYQALGVYSGRARYCMPMDRKNVTRLLEHPPTSPVDLCKLYRGPLTERERGLNVENLLNLGSKVTLEFRYFNGTLSPHLIGCYAGLVMGLTDYAMASRNLPAPGEIRAEPSIPALLQQINMPPTHPVSTLLVGRMLAARASPRRNA